MSAKIALSGQAVGSETRMRVALYNAKLMRDRDDRLRGQEARETALALYAEVNVLVTACKVRGKWAATRAKSGKVPPAFW